jgi:hypothetical protein
MDSSMYKTPRRLIDIKTTTCTQVEPQQIYKLIFACFFHYSLREHKLFFAIDWQEKQVTIKICCRISTS